MTRASSSSRSRTTVIGAVLAILAAACGSPASHHHRGSTTRPSVPAIPADSTLRVGIDRIPTNFNPLTPAGNDDATRSVMVGVWPSAFLTSAGFAPTVNYAFLSSAELVSVDPQTVVYHIKPKASWSDGVPITADDFVYEWHVQSGDPSFRDVGGLPFSVVSTLGYSDIASVIGADGGRTVTVVFKEPFSDWESLFDPVLPSHIAEKAGFNSGFTSLTPALQVSGGPFSIRSISPTQVVLVDNPSYWETAPAVTEIDLDLLADPAAYPTALSSGSIDLVSGPAEIDVMQKLSYLADVDEQLVPSLDFQQIDFNEKNPILASLAVRQAIAHETDRSALIAAGPGQLVQYESLPAEDDNHFFVPGYGGTAQNEDYMLSQQTSNASGYDTPHPDQAARLLTSAGWLQGPDGFWHEGSTTGPILTLRFTSDQSDPILRAVAQTFQAQMKTAGIKINLVNDSPGQLVVDLLTGNYDLAQVTQSASPYPSKFLPVYGSGGGANAPWPNDQAPVTNALGFSDPTVDQLFDQAIANPDAYNAVGLYNQIDAQLWTDMTSLPLYEDSRLVAFSKTVRGLGGPNGPNVSDATVLWDADQWTIKPLATSTTTTLAQHASGPAPGRPRKRSG